MRIGIVSDTHSRSLPKRMMGELAKADLIIHAGDFCSMEDYKEFEKLNAVKAVHGNMDDHEVRSHLPSKQIIHCGQHAVGIYHGAGRPQGVVDVVRREFEKDKVDMVIFGHSHQPFKEVIGGVLYFNPGSPNDDIFAPYRSYGMAEINDVIRADIVRLT